MSGYQSLSTNFWPSGDTGIKYIVKCHLEVRVAYIFFRLLLLFIYKMKTLQYQTRRLQKP